MSNFRYLHCLYAEDIRKEVSGQTTIVGVYQGGLKVGMLPAMLSKFAILATLVLPKDDVPRSLVMRLVMHGRVLQTIEPPSTFLQQKFLELTAENADSTGYSLQFIIGFNNFPVEESGKLEVHAIIDGEPLRGNSFRIELDTSTLTTEPGTQA